jgi:hypothetical protein
VTGSLEYAQARIQARHGARPGAREWAAVHAAISAAALLDAARSTSLASWLPGLEASSSTHDIEAAVRERLRARIGEVALWMPEPWRRAVLWTRALLDLPALQHLAWGRTPPRWMSRDPLVAPHLDDTPDEERARLLRLAWTETWRRLWPPCGGEDREALDALAHAVESHLEAFRRAAGGDAQGLRDALRSRVETLFRRHTLSPAAGFCHLLLVALECERMRAELVARASEAP